MADISSLESAMSDCHLDEDSRYKHLVEMNQYSLEIDDPSKYIELFASSPLQTLLQIPNRYCYKHFDDEDIINSKLQYY